MRRAIDITVRGFVSLLRSGLLLIRPNDFKSAPLPATLAGMARTDLTGLTTCYRKVRSRLRTSSHRGAVTIGKLVMRSLALRPPVRPGVLAIVILLLIFLPATVIPSPAQNGVPLGGLRKTHPVQPWEFPPDPGDDKRRTQAIRLLREIDLVMQERFAALSLLIPRRVASDDKEHPGRPSDLGSSQILSHVNQGAVWASILLTVDPSLLGADLRAFRHDLELHLLNPSKNDTGIPPPSSKGAKRHKVESTSAGARVADAETSYQALVSNMRALYSDYARLLQYQSPRILNPPGEPTTFVLFDPRVLDLQSSSMGNLMMPVSVIRVIQIDEGHFRIEAYDAYRDVWDWEGYVARKRAKRAAGDQGYGLYNSPPFEFNPYEAYISQMPREILTLRFEGGSLVVEGRSSPTGQQSGGLRKIELQPGAFDPTLLFYISEDVGPTQQAAMIEIPLPYLAEPLLTVLTPAPPVTVPTRKVEAVFEMDVNLQWHGATPMSYDQAKIVRTVVDDWLTPYFLNAIGPEADKLRIALPNSNGTLRIHFSVSPVPSDPKDPARIFSACAFEFPYPPTITGCAPSGLSVALPEEHFEMPGEVLLDLISVFIDKASSQDQQASEDLKKSFGKFFSSLDSSTNGNHYVPGYALAQLGAEIGISGKFISVEIPGHPAGALAIQDPEEQGMAYHSIDLFNLLLKQGEYLRRTGHNKQFETTQALVAALPDNLIVHFTIMKEGGLEPSIKRVGQPSPRTSPGVIRLSLPEHAYKATTNDFRILRGALAEAIAKAELPGGPTGPEIANLLDEFLLLYSNDPYNQHDALVGVIKRIYAPARQASP